MIEKFEDLGLDDLDKDLEEMIKDKKSIDIEEFNEFRMKRAESLIQEKLGLSIDELKSALSNYTVANADELSDQFVNIAPLGDYGELLETTDEKITFLKGEGALAKHWLLRAIRKSDIKENLISFEFLNDSVDDGDVFQGFVYVSFQGKIRHAFTQGCDN
jgi:hypothetical protein